MTFFGGKNRVSDAFIECEFDASLWDVVVSLKGIWFDIMNVFCSLEQFYSENVPFIHAWKLETATFKKKLETATFYTYATTEKNEDCRLSGFPLENKEHAIINGNCS